jgi:uncharacterized protein YjeT (DUF2065 family)
MIVQDLLRALALVIVIEGVLPFVAPSLFRQSLLRVAGVDDQRLRLVGLGAMIVGLAALQAVRWFL